MADLQQVIKAIPIAEDGHIISKDYHNSLRTAVNEIARLAHDISRDREESVTLAPSFQVNSPNIGWVINQLYASNQQNPSCDGWLPVLLPDGSRIQRLIGVVGITGTSTPPTQFSFTIRLNRQPFDDPQNIAQIASTPNLGARGNEDKNSFEAEGRFSVPGLSTPAALMEFQLVDNKKNRYFIQSRVTDVPSGVIVLIYAIRIDYLR
jgi:hypothetical protein